jgi:hypothetical protein
VQERSALPEEPLQAAHLRAGFADALPESARQFQRARVDVAVGGDEGQDEEQAPEILSLQREQQSRRAQRRGDLDQSGGPERAFRRLVLAL